MTAEKTEKPTEIKAMALLIADQEKQIASLKYKLENAENNYKYATEQKAEKQNRIRELEVELKELGNKDSIAALLKANQIIIAENKELHTRVDAAFAGVKIDESARKHQLQSIVERLDGIKASVEAALK